MLYVILVVVVVVVAAAVQDVRVMQLQKCWGGTFLRVEDTCTKMAVQ